MGLRQNFGDIVIDKLIKRREAVRAKLAERYKGVKPFRMEKASIDDVMARFNELNTEEKMAAFQQLQGGQK